MTTIKSFTDIEQSRKLAEILPLESADLKWFFWIEEIDAPKTPTFGYSKTVAESYKSAGAVYLPCWSLVALLELMPKLHKLQHSEEGYYCSLANYKCVTESYNNPVDACYEMILRLNEPKIL